MQETDSATTHSIVYTGTTLVTVNSGSGSPSGPWVLGYWPAWEVGTGSNSNPPFSAINFSDLTEISYFGMQPSGGSINGAANGVNSAGATAVVNAAHAAGIKAILTVGGAGTESAFLTSTSSTNLASFVSSIVAYVKSNNFDGVDIDWESLSGSDATNYEAFIEALRAALGSSYLLLAVCPSTTGPVAAVQSYLNQVNICTYDLSGNWGGWVTWYNGAIYEYGTAATNGAEASAGADVLVNQFNQSGIPLSKIGIGSEFGGTVWKGGVTGPNQATGSINSMQYDVPLYGSGSIMQKYFQPQYYRWDAQADAPYLSITNASNAANDYFISYDDANSLNAKFTYIRQKGIGGLVLWDMAMGYPGGGTYPLLNTVRQDRLGNVSASTSFTVAQQPSISTIDSTTKLNISVTAVNTYGVTGVSIYLDSSLAKSCGSSPCNVTVGPFTANTQHSYYATATATAPGTSGTSSTYTFSVVPPATSPPTVSFSYPTSGATVSNTITANVVSTDVGGTGIAKVQLYANGALVGTDTTSPYTFSLNTWSYSNGALTLVANSIDNSGLIGTNSVAVTVQNTAPPALWIYNGTLNHNWHDASYGGTANYASTNTVYNHTDSISLDPSGQWGALSMSTGTPVSNVAGYTSLNFYINGGAVPSSIYILLEGSGSYVESGASDERLVAAGLRSVQHHRPELQRVQQDRLHNGRDLGRHVLRGRHQARAHLIPMGLYQRTLGVPLLYYGPGRQT